MCGRFTQAYTWCELVALYRLTVPATNLEPRYNVVPKTTIETVIARDGELELSRMIRMQTFGRQLNMRFN